MTLPKVSLLQFKDHFEKLFGGDAVSGISAKPAAKLTKIQHTPFPPNEIKIAVIQMKLERFLALATF